MENTDKHWRLWGQLDPYRGVAYPNGLSVGFWEAGESYVDWLLGVIGHIERNNALDFGCGVGRILRPLSTRFRCVTGVDISAAMLSHARRNVPAAKLLEHIPAEKFDLVHSCLVLQHIPVPRGLTIIKQLQARVAIGGVLVVQVPTDIKHSWGYRIKHAVPTTRFLFNALQGKPLREPLMQMNAYPVEAIRESLGGHDLQIITESPRSAFFLWRNELT